MSFSEKMGELERIVARIESEALRLEEALALFERGVGLVRECRAFLTEAKQKISLLTDEGKLSPFAEKRDDEGEQDQ